MNLRDWLNALDPTLLNVTTFTLMLLEGAGIPGIPGALPMLAQVALIDSGHNSLSTAITWGVIGNWLGSLLGYAAGRWGRRWIPPHWLAKLHGKRTTKLIHRWGAPLIIISRTVGSLRTPVTLVSGMMHYPLLPYTLYSLIGALIHVGVWQTILWYFGPEILPVLGRWGRDAALVIITLGALAFLIWKLWSRPTQTDDEEIEVESQTAR